MIEKHNGHCRSPNLALGYDARELIEQMNAKLDEFIKELRHPRAYYPASWRRRG
jgi:hypothetical protein